MRKIFLYLFISLGLVLTACDVDDSEPPSSPDPTTAAPAATLSPVLIDLQRDFEQISESQTAILTIWEDLAANEQVQCGDYPTAISPKDISAEDDPVYEPLADRLRSAAIDTAHAIDLWQAECLNPRAIIPADVIDEGRLSAHAAGDALREARTQLGGIQ